MNQLFRIYLPNDFLQFMKSSIRITLWIAKRITVTYIGTNTRASHVETQRENKVAFESETMYKL